LTKETSGQSSVRWWVGFVDILSLNEAEVHDFSWLNEWFSNEIQALKGVSFMAGSKNSKDTRQFNLD